MPIIKSAKKRVKTAEKAAIRNSKTKRTMRTALKAFHKAVTGGEGTAETNAAAHSEAQSNIDKAAKKGLIHKNKAARQKAQLAKLAKAAASAAPVKKTAAKKPAASKAAPVKKVGAAKKETIAKAPAKTAAKKPATTKK